MDSCLHTSLHQRSCSLASVCGRSLLSDWQCFCRLIHQRFGRDQHELLIRQLYHIKQTSSVQDYIERFTELVEQLKAYTTPDPLYYTTRFMDGLQHDIRSIIMVQRPADLDAACTLALLQEEALEPSHRHDFKKSESSVFSKTVSIKGALALPPPLPRPGNNAHQDHHPADDKRTGGRGVSIDDRLSALRNFCKARGLCIRCGEKWAPSHKCATEMQLHALQEVWNLCQEDFEEPEQEFATSSDAPRQLCMLLSTAAVLGSTAPCTMQFRGLLSGIEVLILVDSGSSHSFLNSETAKKLTGTVPLVHLVSVKIADGGMISLSCVSELPVAEWSVQGHVFNSTLKILPLGTFDVIIGMDWSEAFSPMKVHWRHKWMTNPYGTAIVHLQGLPPEPVECSLVQLFQISADSAANQPVSDESCVQQVLDEFAHLFAEPTELPPRRACGHRIPLIPGAQPVAVCSYRYSPQLKSEIETQVVEMLQTGMIQPSSSAFSSPVLLVRKKDGSWRFCVDYRLLNSLTVKSKFPIPMIDELLDELSFARWFTSLDL